MQRLPQQERKGSGTAPQPRESDLHDIVVIGAGPAGLAAAIYFGRFLRPVTVIEDGTSRARLIPKTRNQPGFPDGIEGNELLARMRRQAERFGAQIQSGRVERLARDASCFSLALADGSERLARFVLLATGSEDIEPELPGVDRAIARGLVRLCPICDAYELRGRRIGVLGRDSHSVQEACFVSTYSDSVTYVHLTPDRPPGAGDRSALETYGVALLESAIDQVHIEKDVIVAFGVAGETHRFDAIYAALGLRSRSGLAEQVGAATDETGCLKVTAHQETSVAGLYAAGDLVRGLNQIAVAEGEGAIAATDIHNRLRALEHAQRAH